ncbi:hypothetical protein EWM64_g9702, partial [Hericium alpestre]
KGHASRPRGDAAKTEGGAAKPKLDGAARLRGRRVVTQESVQDDREIVVLGTSGSGDKDKKKKRAVEESSEEDVVELDSKAKGKVKVKAKKPPKKQSKVDAGEAGGKTKKAAVKARPKAKPRPPAVVQGHPSSDSSPCEAVVDNRSGRSRPTRSSAVTASKRIARQASEESIPLDHGDIEQLEENVKAKATKKAPKANNAKDDGRSSKVHVPEAVSEDARASTPVQIAHVVEPVLVTPVSRFQGMKRKRGVDADTIPVSSSPYPESAEPQTKRKRPLPEVTPKAPTPPRPRKLNTTREKARPTKKYGKAAKNKSLSPVLSVVENVDYDEIPGETGSSARASSPVAKADSPPAKMAPSTGKSKVARMKAKDGSTPVAPEKGKGVSVKDIATSASVAKKEPKSTVRHVQEAEEDDASVVEISPSPVPSKTATASKKTLVKKTKMDAGDQASKAKSVKESASRSTKKQLQNVAQETITTKAQTKVSPYYRQSRLLLTNVKLNEHWSSRKSNKAPWLEEQYAVKTEVGHQDERSSPDDVRAPTDEIQSSSESALPPPPSDIPPVEIPVFDDFDITLGFEAAEDSSTWEQNGKVKAERAVPRAAEKAAVKATKKEAVTIDLTNDSPPPKSKPKPKSRSKPTAPPPREPSEQQEEPAPDVGRPHSGPLNDAEEADDPFAEMDNVYEDTYQDFTVPLNSSGRLLSPTDTSKATSSSDPVQAPQRPLPQSTHSAKKNVTFAPGVQEAEARKLAKEENTIADDSGIFWSNESSEPRSADRSAGIKRLEERRTRKDEEHKAPQAAQTQLQMHPPPAGPKVARSSKAKKITVRPEQAQPETKDTSTASDDPVAEITSIIDAISNVVKIKITDGFDGVSRSAREARRRILNQAMIELDEIGQTNRIYPALGFRFTTSSRTVQFTTIHTKFEAIGFRNDRHIWQAQAHLEKAPQEGQCSVMREYTPHVSFPTRLRLQYSWLPDVFRIKNSIIYRISGPVLTLTLIAVAVAYAWSQGKSLNLTNSITPLLGVVVGLILVFRNGTSYDRYYEGRKSFGNLTSKVRNLSRLIWVNTALPPPDNAIAPSALQGKTPTHTMTAAQLRRVKADALKLCVSFVFAVKHYLREEDGLHWEDYDASCRARSSV